MKTAPFPDLVTCLTGNQPPRAWSFLVTLFGELAQQDGARISGALIRHLTDLIGFKPEAVRVALHRLRKDGWIESRRQGRNSDYGLTDWGRSQSAAASPRIYAAGAMTERAWLVVQEPGQAPVPSGPETAVLTANLLLTSTPPADVTAFVTPVTRSTPLPDWMAQKLCDYGIAVLARNLHAALGELEAQGDLNARLAPCERAALRALIVHDWRRIVLRTPILPDHVFPGDWPGAACREKVAQVLKRLPPQDLSTLERSLAS